MKIVTIGRGQIGSGLAQLWRESGHDATSLGRDGETSRRPTRFSSPFPALGSLKPQPDHRSGGKDRHRRHEHHARPAGEFPSYAEEVKSFTQLPWPRAST